MVNNELGLLDGVTTYDSARVLIADSPSGSVHVVVWIAHGQIQVVLDDEVTGYSPSFGSRDMTLADGRRLTVKPAAGCGCGNPLKSWSPSRDSGIRIVRVQAPQQGHPVPQQTLPPIRA